MGAPPSDRLGNGRPDRPLRPVAAPLLHELGELEHPEDESLGTGRAAGDVDVDGHDPVDALNRRVAPLVTAAGRHDDARWGQLDLIPTKADYILDLIRANSLWPLTSGLACCAIEMMSAATSRNDMDRWGMFPFRASPRQADVLIAAGTLTTKRAGPFLRLWEQMPEPKWCVAMGDCTVSGGRYKRSYSVIEGIDRIMPVDVYIPGCPPRPEGLIYGMLKLAQLVKERRGHWQERQISPNVPDGV